MAGVLEVFLVFLRLGLTSFGGPIAHLGYFHEELIRTLANNDNSLMGPEYPGPSA